MNIASNSWDTDSDQEQYVGRQLFQRNLTDSGTFGILSAKQKSVSFLKQGTSLAIGSQDPPAEIVKKYGSAPDIYTADVNYWV